MGRGGGESEELQLQQLVTRLVLLVRTSWRCLFLLSSVSRLLSPVARYNVCPCPCPCLWLRLFKYLLRLASHSTSYWLLSAVCSSKVCYCHSGVYFVVILRLQVATFTFCEKAKDNVQCWDGSLVLVLVVMWSSSEHTHKSATMPARNCLNLMKLNEKPKEENSTHWFGDS